MRGRQPGEDRAPVSGSERRVAELEQKLRETEAALAAAEARVTERRFQRLVECSGDVLSIVQPDGSVDYVSPVFERITGIAREEAARAGILCAMHPDDVPRALEVL